MKENRAVDIATNEPVWDRSASARLAAVAIVLGLLFFGTPTSIARADEGPPAPDLTGLSDQSAVGSEQEAVGSGQEAGGSGQEAVGSGQEAGGSEQWAGGSGQEAGGGGQEAAGSGQEAVSSGQEAVGSGQEAVGSGQSSVVSSQSSVTDPQSAISNPQSAIPDPYFFSGGVRYSFLPDGGDCSALSNCAVSSTPIQSAIDTAAGGLTPDDGTIYVEGGTYSETVTLANVRDLALQGGADGSPSILNGAVNILDALNVALRNFIFANTVTVADSRDMTLVGTVSDDTITVNVQGAVENLSVDGGAGGDAVTLNMEASSATVTAADGGSSAGDSLTVNTTGADDQVTLTATTVTVNDTQTITTSAIETLTINTGAGDDALTVDNSGGQIQSQITYDGGAGYDVLNVVGDGVSSGSYTPTPGQPDSGVMTVGSAAIAFTGVEPTTQSSLASYTLTTPSTNDVLTIDSPAAGQNRISGTSGGTAFESLTFYDITNFTLDTATNDGASPNDSITFNSNLAATGLKNFSLSTGAGDDSVNLAAMTSLSLPVSGGIFGINGGAGTDTLTGPNIDNSWYVTGSNSGTLNSFSLVSDTTALTWDATAGAPANWQGVGFADAGWANAVVTTCPSYGVWVSAPTGASWIWYPNCTQASQTVLFRKSFTLASAATATLTVASDDSGTAYINGTQVASGIGFGAYTTVDNLSLGAGANVLAVSVTNGGGPGGATFRLASPSLLEFSGFENLTGGTGADTFNFASNVGSVSGTVDGGAGSDSASWSAWTNPATVSLLSVVNVETVTGGSGADTLIGANASNTWTISPATTSDLAGYWKFDDGSGTTAIDSSGNGKNGTLTNGPAYSGDVPTTSFTNSGALNFDGTNDYVSLPGTWGGGAETTVSAWFKVNATSADFEAIVSPTDLQFVHLQLAAGGNTVVYVDTADIVLPIVTQTPTGAYRHIALTIKSGDTRLYENGIQIATSAQTFTSIDSTSSLRIGSGYAGGRFFNGLIDDVRIYNRALSAFEVASVRAGSVGTVGAVNFTSFENLTGGSSDDTFAFGNGLRLTGTLDGGGGTDTLSLANYTTANTWSITGSGAGNANSNLAFTNVENLTGGTGADTYGYTFAGSGSGTTTITDAGGVDTLTANGTGGVETITLTGTAITRGSETLNYSGVETLTVNTGAGADTLTINGDVTVTNLTLVSAGNITRTGGTLTATNIVLDSATGVGASGAPILTATPTGVTWATVAARATTSGGVFVTNTGGLDINLVGGLDGVDANGGGINLIANSPLRVSRGVRENLGGNINLSAGGSSSGDNLTIQANITSTNNGGISLTAGNNISLEVSARVSAPGLGAISFSAGVSNSGGTLNIAGQVSAGAGLTTLSGAGGVTLGATSQITTGGGNVVALSANGSVTQSAGGVINTGSGGLGIAARNGASFSGTNTVTTLGVYLSGSGAGVSFTSTGPLIIGTVQAIGGVSTQNGGVYVSAPGALTVATGISAGMGSVSLIATGTNSRLNLNAPVAGGTVAVQADERNFNSPVSGWIIERTAAGVFIPPPPGRDPFAPPATLPLDTNPILVRVPPGARVVLSDLGPSVTGNTIMTPITLQLSGGPQVTINGVPADTELTLAAPALTSLPAALPAGVTLLSSLSIGMVCDGVPTIVLEGAGTMRVSFSRPAVAAGSALSLLYFNSSQGGWVTVPGAQITADGRVIADVNFAGVFVLASVESSQPVVTNVGFALTSAADQTTETLPALTGNTVEAALTGDTAQTVSLELPQGGAVAVTGGAGQAVTVTAETGDTLPGGVPADSALASGFTIAVTGGQNSISYIPSGEGLEVSFALPPGGGGTYHILYWNALLNGGQGGWIEMPGAYITADGRVAAPTFFTGTYVLVQR